MQSEKLLFACCLSDTFHSNFGFLRRYKFEKYRPQKFSDTKNFERFFSDTSVSENKNVRNLWKLK